MRDGVLVTRLGGGLLFFGLAAVVVLYLGQAIGAALYPSLVAVVVTASGAGLLAARPTAGLSGMGARAGFGALAAGGLLVVAAAIRAMLGEVSGSADIGLVLLLASLPALFGAVILLGIGCLRAGGPYRLSGLMTAAGALVFVLGSTLQLAFIGMPGLLGAVAGIAGIGLVALAGLDPVRLTEPEAD